MKIGAYAIERDYSHYVAYAAKTVLAVVGTASKGPIGVPTVCTTAQDLVNKFGPLKLGYYGLYAAQYFLSQASKVYFVRAASDKAKKSFNFFTDTMQLDETGGATALVYALEEGTYSNGWTVTTTKYITEETVSLASDGRNLKIDTKVTMYTSLEDAGEVINTSSRESLTYDHVNENGETMGVHTFYSYDFLVRNKEGATIESIKSVTLDSINNCFSSNYIKVCASTNTEGNLNVVVDPASIRPGTVMLSGGHDGEDAVAADYINAANSLLADQVDMNLFAVPGNSDNAVITAMLSLAENRGDCLYLVDPPAELDRDGVAAWVNGKDPFTGTVLNSSYGALYYDWVTIYDSVNKKRVQVPPSVVVAATFAYSDRISELWYAPAGLNRGIVRGVLDSVTKLNKADTEYLYEESINSLYDDPQVGLVIWGQKTLHQADTALNRVNVRRLMNYLKRIVVAACNYLTFEPNDRITWNNFKMKIVPTLENIKNKRGIYEYRVIKGDTIVTPEDIDNYRMPCMIMIRPTKAAEEIPIYFVITSTGADFNEVLEANGVVSN